MRGSSSNVLCIVDARAAGVSGDKYLGALLQLGGSTETLGRVARIVKVNLPGVTEVNVTATDVERGEIGARLVTVSSKEETRKRKASVMIAAAVRCAKKLGLSRWGIEFVSSTFETLTMAESRVHDQKSSTVELHELGSADTLVDVLGVAALIGELGLEKSRWVSTLVAVGSGTSHFSRKEYPNPPPAVLEILRSHKFPMRTGPVEGELTTPTGAAITVNLVSDATDSYPDIRPQKIGYGAGSRELTEIANILRIIVGSSAGGNGQHEHDRVVVLETNLDDVTGEIIGHAMEQVMGAGARDVTVTPVLMKKNRPGYLLSVIADAKKAEELSGVIIKETGTLGVREIPVTRHIVLREQRKGWLQVNGERRPFIFKVAMDKKGNVLKEKVEYKDRKRLAKEFDLGLAEVDVLLGDKMRRGKTAQ